MRILHIAPDEKFINSIHWQFEEVFPNKSQYFVFLAKNQPDLRLVKVTKNVRLLKQDKKGLQTILDQINESDFVILHGLNYLQSKIVHKASDTVKFLWFFWGGEIYDNPYGLKFEMIGGKTKKRFYVVSLRSRIKYLIRPLYYSIVHNTLVPEKYILNAAKKITRIGIIHKEEIVLLKERGFFNKAAKHIPMTYYPMEFIFKNMDDDYATGNNILLGNSSSLTNNHIEAFNILQKLDLKERKIVMPLSYGDKNYAKEISAIGEEKFPGQIISLTDFMPLSEYNEIIKDCSTVIMNHFRQQAIGNILAMLWMGAKVYLNDDNTFYPFLKRRGIQVFSIKDDLVPTNPLALENLSLDQVTSNRKILKSIIGFDTVRRKLETSLRAVVDES